MASMVPVTSVDLAFDDAGSGPAVVLIHGHPFNRTMWAPQVAALRDRYRVIAPDLRGYGQSPVTPGLVTMAELAADIRALLDRLGVESAALTGLSMGGLVLMELAAAEPGRWWALGFIATTAQPPSPEDAAARMEMAQTAEEQGMGPIAEIMGPRLFGPDPDQALTARITDMMLATNPLGAAAALRGRAQRPDYRPILRSLRTSSLVCTGDHDGYSTAEVTGELVACLRDPEVVLLKDVGHLPNLEQADAFDDHLLAFLNRNRP
jgi:3-oxoadipate enol-lactonase